MKGLRMKKTLILLTLLLSNTLALGGTLTCPGEKEGEYNNYKDVVSGALHPHLNATMRGYVDTPRWNAINPPLFEWWLKYNSLTSFTDNWAEKAALNRKMSPNYSRGVPPLFSVSGLAPYNEGYYCTDTRGLSYPICKSTYLLDINHPGLDGNPNYTPGHPIGESISSNVLRLYPLQMSTEQVSNFEVVLNMIKHYDKRVAFIPMIIDDWPTDSPHHMAGDSAHIVITENKNGTLKRFFYVPRSLLELGRLNKQYKSADGKWYSMTLTRVMLHEIIHELLHYANEKEVEKLLFSESKRFTYEQEQEVVSLVNMLLMGTGGVYGEVEAERSSFTQTRTVLSDGTFDCHDDLENGH